MVKLYSTIAVLLCLFLSSCGGHSPWSGSSGNTDGVPSAPNGLMANAGDGAVSLGWAAPTTNGTSPISYNISISPSLSAALITITGTTALVRGLSNNTTYTFSVTATNSSGTGPAIPIQATPAAVLASSYLLLSLDNNNVADPSLLKAASGDIWLAYTKISTTVISGNTIQNNETNIAHAINGGAAYQTDTTTAGKAMPASISAPSTLCGASCSGWWLYRTPWLIEDSSDPDASRRFKLFAHKYFVDNSGNIYYQLGGIVMWTAAVPNGTWSLEQGLLKWQASLIQAPDAIEGINPALQSCAWIDEGSASIYNNGIDFVFSCVDSISAQRSIVLLRSTDHLNTFTYVATLLQPGDANTYNADHFDGPALLPTAGNAPVLMATPVDGNGISLGCVIFPIADENAGTLFIASGAPLAIQTLPPLTGSDSGNCTWDRGLLTHGVLMGDHTGTIQATTKSL